MLDKETINEILSIAKKIQKLAQDAGTATYDHPLLINALSRFSEKFDIHAVGRYLKWAEENNESPNSILATIIHDLNGMNDVSFSPRTESY